MSQSLSPIPTSWPLDGLNILNPDEPREEDVTARGTYCYTQGNESIRQCIWNILLTRPGERLMRPEFGVGLRDFAHHPNNETTRRLMADMIQRGIERWENRIELNAVEISMDPINLAQVNITISYKLRNNGQADGLSFNLSMDG